MIWVIVLVGLALVIYRYGVPSTYTQHVADHVAAGAAGGARTASKGYFRRRDLAWAIGGGLALFIFLFSALGGDDDNSASATETAEAAPTTETISSPLSFGDRGDDVVILQERLVAEGLPVAVDGVYGPETADAVSAFQEQEQLTVDGTVSPDTAEALGISVN